VGELPVRAAPPGRATRLAVGLATPAVTIFLSAAVSASEGTSEDAILNGATVDNCSEFIHPRTRRWSRGSQ